MTPRRNNPFANPGRRWTAAAAILLLFLIACGDESPTEPGNTLADSFEPAATPEEFVALLQTAYNQKDLDRYGKLLDPDFEFQRLWWNLGDSGSWNRDWELISAQRIFSGEEILDGYGVSDFEFQLSFTNASVDTMDRDERIEGETWWQVEIEVRMRVDYEPDSWEWSWYGQTWPSRQTLTLKPHPTIPGHLAMRKQVDRRWNHRSAVKPQTEKHFWGELKARYLQGPDTPETFFKRFERKYALRDRYRSGGYHEMLAPDFKFYPLPQDVRSGSNPAYGRGDEMTIAERMSARWTNNMGWRSDSVVVRLNPTRIEELQSPQKTPNHFARSWRVEVDAYLEIHMTGPYPVGKLVKQVRNPQTFLLRPHSDRPTRLVAAEQRESPPADGYDGVTWGYVRAMYLPESPEDFLKSFVSTYNDRNSEEYTGLLGSDYQFHTPDGEEWDFAEEAALAEIMFGGGTNRRGEQMVACNLIMFLEPNSLSGKTTKESVPGERRFHADAVCKLTAGMQLADGSDYEYRTRSVQSFELQPDPDYPGRLLLARQSDSEFIRDVVGPSKQADEGRLIVELDADGTVDGVRDVIDLDAGEPLSVDIWISGTDPIAAFNVDILYPTIDLELESVDFTSLEGWATSSSPSTGILLSGWHPSESLDIENPTKLATLLFRAKENRSFGSIDIGRENSYAVGIDFINIAFAGNNSIAVRLGNPRYETTGWGTIKNLFR